MRHENVQPIVDKIARIGRHLDRVQLMEVCGTHTMSLFRSGIRSVLPSNLELVSGPGCPVCVTSQGYIDVACQLATRPDVIICTYGDMVRVPDGWPTSFGGGGGDDRRHSPERISSSPPCPKDMGHPAWSVFDPASAGVGTGIDGHHTGVFDGRYVYFAPTNWNYPELVHGEVLRYDTGQTEPVPAASVWGIIVMAILLMTAGTVALLQRRSLETRF